MDYFEKAIDKLDISGNYASKNNLSEYYLQKAQVYALLAIADELRKMNGTAQLMTPQEYKDMLARVDQEKREDV